MTYGLVRLAASILLEDLHASRIGEPAGAAFPHAMGSYDVPHRGQLLRARAAALSRIAARRPGVSWFTAAAALLCGRILVPGPVGMADNSDGRRLICQLSAAPPQGWHDSAYWWHTQFLYTANSSPCLVSYRSSQLLVLRAAAWITRLILPHEALDLRVAGVLTVLAWAAAVALVRLGAPGSARTGALLAGGLLLILLDAQFADYPISAYSEPAIITGFCFVLAGALWMRRAGRAGWVGAAVFAGGATFLLTAKQQTLTVVPALILLVWLTPMAVLAGRGRIARAGGKSLLLAVILGITALAPAGAAASAQLTEQTRFNLIVDRILPLDGHPAADLAALGLPAADAQYERIPAWCAATLYPQRIPALEAIGSIGYGRIAGFLLSHPATAWRVAQYAATSGFDQSRPTAVFCAGNTYRLGDYPASASAGVRYDERFAPIGLALRLLRPGGLPLLALLWLALSACCLRARRGPRRERLRPVADLGLFCVLAAVAQFATAAFGDGVDDAKHMNLAVLATAVACLCAARCAAPRPATRIRGARASERPVPTRVLQEEKG
jgi:hypothetical protein